MGKASRGSVVEALGALGLLAVLACGGCISGGGSGDSDGGPAAGAGSCPRLGSTAWTLTQHCEPSFVGMTSTVSQSGCNYTTRLGEYECAGTIGQGGELSHSCTGPDSAQISCTGYVVGESMDLDCDGCIVELAAQ